MWVPTSVRLDFLFIIYQKKKKSIFCTVKERADLFEIYVDTIGTN